MVSGRGVVFAPSPSCPHCQCPRRFDFLVCNYDDTVCHNPICPRHMHDQAEQGLLSDDGVLGDVFWAEAHAVRTQCTEMSSLSVSVMGTVVAIEPRIQTALPRNSSDASINTAAACPPAAAASASASASTGCIARPPAAASACSATKGASHAAKTGPARGIGRKPVAVHYTTSKAKSKNKAKRVATERKTGKQGAVKGAPTPLPPAMHLAAAATERTKGKQGAIKGAPTPRPPVIHLTAAADLRARLGTPPKARLFAPTMPPTAPAARTSGTANWPVGKFTIRPDGRDVGKTSDLAPPDAPRLLHVRDSPIPAVMRTGREWPRLAPGGTALLPCNHSCISTGLLWGGGRG